MDRAGGREKSHLAPPPPIHTLFLTPKSPAKKPPFLNGVSFTYFIYLHLFPSFPEFETQHKATYKSKNIQTNTKWLS